MHNYDPKLLRRLAATYRARAETEPDMAHTFRQIAHDMEGHALRLEESGIIAFPVRKTRSASGSN